MTSGTIKLVQKQPTNRFYIRLLVPVVQETQELVQSSCYFLRKTPCCTASRRHAGAQQKMHLQPHRGYGQSTCSFLSASAFARSSRRTSSQLDVVFLAVSHRTSDAACPPLTCRKHARDRIRSRSLTAFADKAAGHNACSKEHHHMHERPLHRKTAKLWSCESPIQLAPPHGDHCYTREACLTKAPWVSYAHLTTLPPVEKTCQPNQPDQGGYHDSRCRITKAVMGAPSQPTLHTFSG